MARVGEYHKTAFCLGLILTVVCSAAAGARPALANVSGAALQSVTPAPLPTGTFDITFTVHYPALDSEYMDRFDVTLPAGWTINSVVHKAGDSFCPSTTEGHDGQTIYWQRNTTLPSGCGAWSGENDPYTFTANVTIPSCPVGAISLNWNVLGDQFIASDPPHTKSGSFPLSFDCVTTVPSKPTAVKAVPGDGQATVSFVPGYDGGSPISGFTVTSSPDGITATGSSSPIVVAGLTNGTEYTFVVTATNSIGTGPASDPSNVVTPWPGLIGSGDVPKDIPDNYPGGVTSSLTISPGICANITDLNVAVNITHSWLGDLTVTLTHEDTGTAAVILDLAYDCEGGGTIDVVLDDSAASAVADQCAHTLGTFRPNELLSAFNGETAAGTWTLTVFDNASEDTGTLNSWGLILSCGVPGTYTLNVTKSGTGSGTVTSNPAGINCGNDCQEIYDFGTDVDLTATPSDSCTFMTYSGACAGNTNPCTVKMDDNKTVNVDFDTHYVWIEGTSYYAVSIQSAYDGALTGDVLRSRASSEAGNLLFGADKQVTIKGGFSDCSYTSNTGNFTTINGSMTIGGQGSGAGNVIIENIAVK